MDGLVSNFALVAGVVGGGASSHTVVLTGLAGLAAGACSMASGEYISVSSQTELMRAEIAVEQRELHSNPKEELRELTAIFEAKGIRPELASEVARELTSDPEVAWRVHVREELGVDPDDLPSPWTAAFSSFLAFSLGAVLPVLPYLLGATALWPAAVLAVLGLFGCGAVVARVTARSWWFSGLRQLVLGSSAAAVTFLLGRLIGGAIG
jgi:VIT1/CCC1 family predicted Fe2+/Mn2+ transporter